MTPLSGHIRKAFNGLAAAALIAAAPGEGRAEAPDQRAWHEQPAGKPGIVPANVDAPCDERPPGARPEFVVLHSTETWDTATALRTLSRNVSAHYLVARDGVILQLVAEDKAAWHAGGPANWEGSTENFNMRSIGVEIVNVAGHPYPDAQMRAARDLVCDIQRRHGIPPHRVLAHSDVNIANRGDPGPTFPWEEMARYGIGITPAGADAELEGDYRAFRPKDAEYAQIRDLMTRLGYDGRQPLSLVIRNFNMHHDARAFRKNFFWRDKPTARVLRLAQSLVQQKKLLDMVGGVAQPPVP